LEVKIVYKNSMPQLCASWSENVEEEEEVEGDADEEEDMVMYDLFLSFIAVFSSL
jgi:hypothetical protein